MTKERYKTPYANLAYAIIRSGEIANDKRFLNSDWCDVLREICRLDDELHPGPEGRYLSSYSRIR